MQRFSILAILLAAMLAVGGAIFASVGSAFSLAFHGVNAVAWTSSPTTLVDRQFDLGDATHVSIVARNLDIRIVPSAAAGNSLHVTGRVPSDLASHIAFARDGAIASLTLVPDSETTPSWSFSMFDSPKPLLITLDGSRRVDVVATSGDVSLENWRAPTTIGTTSGDVRVSGSRARTTIHTTSGDLHAIDVASGLDVQTASGDVRASFAAVPSDVSIATASGDIDLGVPPAIRAALHTATASGDVDNGPGLPANLPGAPTITAKTSSGDIVVHH